MADEELRIFKGANEIATKDANRDTLIFKISPEILYQNSYKSVLLNKMAVEVIVKTNPELSAVGGSFYECAIFIG